MIADETVCQEPPETDCPIIFPLSPDPDLADSEQQTSVYFKHLSTAFDEPRIGNIAVTGCYGVGKSSIIRSFERHRRQKQEEQGSSDGHRIKRGAVNSVKRAGFLYISLGAFAAPESESMSTSTPAAQPKFSVSIPTLGVNETDEENADGGADGKDAGNLQELNAIERRLLLQIYAQFHRKDLPLSSFRLIREEINLRRIISVICAFFACAVILLAFHTGIGRLLSSLPAPTSPAWLAQFNNWIAVHRGHIHLVLYGFAIISFSLAVGVLSYRVLPHLRLGSISLKSDNAELALEKETCESYLDLYSMELVYCLTQIVDKIDSTVVFEDLDRLSPNVYIQIFTRLREINYLVNLRLAQSNKRIRFVYAISDERLCRIEHYKFFDYILPIIPYLNQKSVEVVLIERLKKINRSLGYNESSRIVDVVRKISPHLYDFRLQNTILNEYGLLAELYIVNNQERLAWERDTLDIFCFAIYKSIWPEDYYKLCKNTNPILLDPNRQYPSGFQKQSLFELLTDSSDPLLTPRCLYYAGFNEKEIADRRRERWKNATPKEIVQDIDTIQAVDYENLKCVREFCTSQTPDEIVYAAIRCMVRCKQKDNQWFFSLELSKCLKVLAAEMDENLKREFFALSNTSTTENIYITTPDAIIGLSTITQVELKELCRGIRVFSGNIFLSIDGNRTELAERNPLIASIRAELNQSNP